MKRLSTYLLLASFLVLGGLGCKGQTAEQQALIQPVVLDYWTVHNDANMLRQFAAEYKLLRPYVTINIRQVQYSEFENLFVGALADDVAPDVVSMHSLWLREQQSRLSTMPPVVNVANVLVEGGLEKKVTVTPLQAAMPTVNQVQRNYVAAVGERAVIDGAVYGLPLAFDTLAIYYNTTLLDRAGIAVPPADWTEFADAVKKTTRVDAEGNIVQAGVALGTGSNVDNAFDVATALLLQNGINMESSGIVQFAAELGRTGEAHPTIQALQFYRDFANPDRDTYSWNNSQVSAIDAFARGQAAFYIGHAFDATRIRARGPQLDFEVVPLYQLDANNPTNVANFWVESVVKKSPDQDEAWDFIRYMSAPENVAKYVEATGQPSPIRAQITAQQEDPVVAPFAEQALVATTWYSGRDYDATVNAFRVMLDDLNGPVEENKTPFDRDVAAINRAVQTIQQTY